MIPRGVRALVLASVLLGLLVGGLFWLDPGKRFGGNAPPVEEISFERVELERGIVRAHIRNVAPASVTIAQVAVDNAFWAYRIEPSDTLGKFERATITLDYPWVEGDPLRLRVVTTSGLTFDHEVAVAVATPVVNAKAIGDYAWAGLLVGLIPVAAGMLLLPAMEGMSQRWHGALLAFTMGVLAFLAVDAASEGLDAARGLPDALHGVPAFAASALLAIVLVLLVDRLVRRRVSGAWALAVLLAVGIGVHNLGEGLAVGAAFAAGSLALGTSLIVGFALHNVTEGPVIVGPLVGAGRPRWFAVAGLATIGGLPTVLGAWLGAFASSGLLTVIFLGLGVGAVLVVFVQVFGALRAEGEQWNTPMSLAAFALGFLVMLATAFLV